MSKGRLYTVEFENVAVTASQDFFELAAGDDKPISIAGIFLAQSTELGDAAEEQLRLRIIRGHTTSGSVGGTAPTPRPVNPRDGAAAFTCEINNTTIASAGTPVNLFSHGWNIRGEYGLWIPDEMEIDTDQATGLLVVRLLNTPTDSISISGTLFVREQ